MSDPLEPTPEPRGDLVPPPRVPPTAVATSAPMPEPLPSRAWRPPELRRRHAALAAIDAALDMLDNAGDAIAEAIGLR
jgi:hypothetical protein